MVHPSTTTRWFSCYGWITDHIRLGLGLPFQSTVSIPSFCYGLNPISWGVKSLFVSEKKYYSHEKKWNVSKLYKKNWTPLFPNVLSWCLPRCSSFFQQFSHLFPNWFQVLQSGSMYSCFPHRFLLPSFPICFQLYSVSQILFPINCPNCIPSASFNYDSSQPSNGQPPNVFPPARKRFGIPIHFPQKISNLPAISRWISQAFRGFNPQVETTIGHGSSKMFPHKKSSMLAEEIQDLSSIRCLTMGKSYRRYRRYRLVN